MLGAHWEGSTIIHEQVYTGGLQVPHRGSKKEGTGRCTLDYVIMKYKQGMGLAAQLGDTAYVG